MSNRTPNNYQQEGLARFNVGLAFFRSSSQTGRDLAVLAAISHREGLAIAYKQSLQSTPFRVLDAMTGCGVRPLRYALEAGADFVWANEGNTDLRSLLTQNLSQSLPCDRYRITHQDANAVFFDCYQRQDFYDLIDIDGFGSPMPTLTTALWAVKLGGLLYLTSTDGRATSGHAPDKSLQTYAAYARAHPAVHEQGLRLLIGLAVQQAAAKGLTAQPVFAYYNGEVNRVMMRITQQSAWNSAHYGFISYCHNCGQFQQVPWKKLGRSPKACACEEDYRPVVSGPMWLGPLHNTGELSRMKAAAVSLQYSLPKDDPTTARWHNIQLLVETMQAEASLPPYYYPLADIGRRGKMDIPPKQKLLTALQQQGFTAVSTHLSTQAIKTDASLSRCIEIARQINWHNPNTHRNPPFVP